MNRNVFAKNVFANIASVVLAISVNFSMIGAVVLLFNGHTPLRAVLAPSPTATNDA